MDEGGDFDMIINHNHNSNEDHKNNKIICSLHMQSEASCISVAVGVCAENATHTDFVSKSEADCFDPSTAWSLTSNLSEYMFNVTTTCSTGNINAIREFLPGCLVMNAMTAEDYKETYWPRLEKAVEHLLTQSPVKYTSISYEQIYSHVYKCVCQQYSEQLYSDLIWKITSHLQKLCLELQESRPESFVENFNLSFNQYMAAIQCIVPVFTYMNKFYIETKLNRDLKDDLMDLFSAHVAEKHISMLISLLTKSDAMPFQIKPSTMASVVKGLYALRPDWSQLAPNLFSKFIPQIHSPVLESDLLCYAAQDKKLQMDLLLHGFSRCNQSRKRANEGS
ncbi:CDK2-associated and cullin domain-containing protein 1 isoform 2-T2 [Clarias gariepinus]|uniref:CDK2-associated and cullin domain-containing protein 1 isoform X2 n=1 Tax=Clarias gariepinus TaxID=13013 RepID=UPI00234C875B|nr:CDK2-associated and cullin domain-containing protein 1 isoform X2 [Clarias gariepinus]